jgi:iron(III) transport system ATP-binding protein
MISIRGLQKLYKSGDAVAGVRDVSLEVAEGEFFVLIGSSGSGKTTLLRCIAGLEKPDAGEIAFEDRVVYSAARRILLRPEERRLGMVFQSYAIWPHMTVYENVATPLQDGWLKLPPAEVRERVHEALALVGMETLAARPAPLLSGGQQQRVALARALALKPALLLMDEPLSNLDARLREEVRGEIRALVKRLGLTVVYVTHDQEEAMELADRMAVLRAGSVAQIGLPGEVYLQPADVETAQFMGSMNTLPGQASPHGFVTTGIGRHDIAVAGDPAVIVGIRPQSVALRAVDASTAPMPAANTFRGTVTSASFLGNDWIYAIRIGSQTLKVRAPWTTRVAGEVEVTIAPEDLCVFDSASGRRRDTEGTGR